MSKKNEINTLDKNLLTIPVYLNTKIVFDMLATIENGFSAVKTVQTSDSNSKEDGVNANIGASNIFAFLNIGLNAKENRTNTSGTVTSENKTHTPVSLFQYLKKQLENSHLIKNKENEFKVGDFVEIQSDLQQNPLIDILSNFLGLFEVLRDFDNTSSKNKKNSSKKDKQTEMQIKSLLNGMKKDDKIDIICKSKDREFVISVDINYFINKNINELSEGNYKILGKVARICDNPD